MAVPVQIAGRDPASEKRRSAEGSGRLEGPIAVAQDDDEAGGGGDRQVELAIAIEIGGHQLGIQPGQGSQQIGGDWKVPSPLPRTTTKPVVVVIARSSLPSPLKSAATNSASSPVRGVSTPGLNTPPPLPVNSQMPLWPTVATSVMPSPLKSPRTR